MIGGVNGDWEGDGGREVVPTCAILDGHLLGSSGLARTIAKCIPLIFSYDSGLPTGGPVGVGPEDFLLGSMAVFQ